MIVFLVLDLIRIYPPIKNLKILIEEVGRPVIVIVYLYSRQTVLIRTLQPRLTRLLKKQEKEKEKGLNVVLFVAVVIILVVALLMTNYVTTFNAKLKIPCRHPYYSGKKTFYQEMKVWLKVLRRYYYPNYDKFVLGFKIIIIKRTLLIIIYDIKTRFVKKIRQLIQIIYVFNIIIFYLKIIFFNFKFIWFNICRQIFWNTFSKIEFRIVT